MSRVARQPHFYYHSEYEAMDNAEISICKESDLASGAITQYDIIWFPERRR